MKNFRKCFVCKQQWPTMRDYLKDENIIFDRTLSRKGRNYVVFRCKNCGTKHDVKRELILNLDPDCRGLLIKKLRDYTDLISLQA
ncbi:hypothetical protein ES702_06528 [subsurface metagenome]